MKKILISVLALILLVGCVWITCVPEPTPDYPKDCSVETYKENIKKNSMIIIDELESIDEPTLKEAMEEYEKRADTIAFYPTAVDTIEQAARLFKNEDRCLFFKEWRVQRFMNKHYPNAYEFQRQYEEQSHKSAEEVQYPEGYKIETYTYKDGSVIEFDVGGMKIHYDE